MAAVAGAARREEKPASAPVPRKEEGAGKTRREGSDGVHRRGPSSGGGSSGGGSSGTEDGVAAAERRRRKGTGGKRKKKQSASAIVDSEDERPYDPRLDDLEALRLAVRGSELRIAMLRQWEATRAGTDTGGSRQLYAQAAVEAELLRALEETDLLRGVSPRAPRPAGKATAPDLSVPVVERKGSAVHKRSLSDGGAVAAAKEAQTAAAPAAVDPRLAATATGAIGPVSSSNNLRHSERSVERSQPLKASAHAFVVTVPHVLKSGLLWRAGAGR